MVSGINNQMSQISALSLSKTNDGDSDDIPSAKMSLSKGFVNQVSQTTNLNSLLKKTNDGDADDVPSANNASSNNSNAISRYNQIQDPSTVTAEQLQSPIDLRV